MPFDIDELNPATRFWLDEDKTEWVEIRLPSREDGKALLDRCKVKKRVEYVPNPKTRQLERIEYIDGDNEAYVDEFIDYVIVAWNLLTPNGDEIQCNRANKLRLYNGSAEFRALIDGFVERLREDVEKKREALRKN